MKIITTGIAKDAWWHGLQSVCGHCQGIIEWENGDLALDSVFSQADRNILKCYCPTCETTIILVNPATKKTDLLSLGTATR